ncbi:GlxA family transcriptional regulator [Massilia sp. NR 4-1]|uniref:GlxA family transcriptional regulator n=1 Tax=Massilia sp. NR 4-1 TaxID=1678028 RepID=UPI00067A811C|nr:GlxA family transcriptional regulator [Massilia sp. NR 4-1]AKU21691.1 hypothetical protein ACZ75_09640 [Massilia sp. NR 4-1]
MSKRLAAPRRIVFVATDLAEELDLFGSVAAFRAANRSPALCSPAYSIEIVSGARTAAIAGNCGITLLSNGSCFDLRGAIDTLIVISGEHAHRPHSKELLAWLAAHGPKARRLVSICTGAFVLAQAGLLDGRRVTTHWSRAAMLAERFPAADVSANELWVKDGPVYTSAGVTAGIDLTLALIEDDIGAPAALEVARGLVVFLRRPGGQAQFSVTLAAQQAQTPAIRALQAWLPEHLAEDLNVQRLADRAAMSARHFARVFRRELGDTPAAYVQRLRLEQARWMLEDGSWSIERIAALCGFSDAQLMRRALKRALGVSPGQYRSLHHAPPA